MIDPFLATYSIRGTNEHKFFFSKFRYKDTAERIINTRIEPSCINCKNML